MARRCPHRDVGPQGGCVWLGLTGLWADGGVSSLGALAALVGAVLHQVGPRKFYRFSQEGSRDFWAYLHPTQSQAACVKLPHEGPDGGQRLGMEKERSRGGEGHGEPLLQQGGAGWQN